eukprot:877256-Rhodomonas_salina.1
MSRPERKRRSGGARSCWGSEVEQGVCKTRSRSVVKRQRQGFGFSSLRLEHVSSQRWERVRGYGQVRNHSKARPEEQERQSRSKEGGESTAGATTTSESLLMMSVFIPASTPHCFCLGRNTEGCQCSRLGPVRPPRSS